MTSPSPVDPIMSQIWAMFRSVAPDSFFDAFKPTSGAGSRGGIFDLSVVIWLMIYQRLHSKGTLDVAVQQLARLARNGQWPLAGAGKRLREARVSSKTGGYCQARQKLSTLVVSQLTESMYEQLRRHLPAGAGPPVLLIDGTTIQLSHEPELVRAFPPGRNQHGDNHWPVLLLVAFHDARTGLAAAPAWGPMYGPQAVSEQELAKQALGRLPADAIVMADSNFGIFAFAQAVAASRRLLIARLTTVRAKKLTGGMFPPAGTRRKVTWTPSAYEKKMHPDLAPGASLQGWVIVCNHPARPGEKLYLFTTMDQEPPQVLAWYKLRWNIETDLRSLKRTVRLHQISAKRESMVEKELLVAVAAYNFVRAVMAIAAHRQQAQPRDFSFSVAQDAVMAAWQDLQQAATPERYQQQLELLLFFVSKAKLPQRARPRSYPREIWGRGGHFPFRRSPSHRAPRGEKN